MKILIAEDDPTLRRILEMNLNKWGYEIVSTDNGVKALQALEAENAPLLAILDWMMPEMDGLEVCRRIRQSALEPAPYVILLTARHGKEDIVKGLELGADDYLTKPYHRDELRVRIKVGERILQLQSKLAERVQQLEHALNQVKRLQGIIPICGYCKKIRDDTDYWQTLETYISTYSEAEFSHGICPSCYEVKVQPQLDSLRLERS